MSINDCFKAPDRLISLAQAMDFMAAQIQPVTAAESLPLSLAEGRVLAENVVAGVTSPPFACAAMDGFAFRHADLPGPFRVTARIAAGVPFAGGFGPGHAARIFTGAPMPLDLDTLVMQEDVRLERGPEGEIVHVPDGLSAGNFVRPAGEDFSAGHVVLHSGKRLRPQDLSMAAGVGRTHLVVRERLKVALFSTGDEVIEPGQPLPEGGIYGGNRFGLAALLARWGCAVSDLGNIPDDAGQTRRHLQMAAQDHDLIVTTGGVSVGGEDHVRGAVEALGAIHLWRMALKPGKPTALGHVGKAAFVGLPGYPVSSLVMAMIVARPVILRLSGRVAEPLQPARLLVRAGFAFDKDHSRRQFLRATLGQDDTGRPVAHLYRSQEPSVLSSLTETDGLIDVGEDVRRINPGELVDYLPYAVLQW